MENQDATSEAQGYGYCIKCWVNAGALCTPCFMKERKEELEEKAKLDETQK